MFRKLKRLLLLVGIGAVAKKVMDSRSGTSGTSGSAQWPPINPRSTK